MVSVGATWGKKRQIPLALLFLHLIFIAGKLKFDNGITKCEYPNLGYSQALGSSLKMRKD